MWGLCEICHFGVSKTYKSPHPPQAIINAVQTSLLTAWYFPLIPVVGEMGFTLTPPLFNIVQPPGGCDCECEPYPGLLTALSDASCQLCGCIHLTYAPLCMHSLLEPLLFVCIAFWSLSCVYAQPKVVACLTPSWDMLVFWKWGVKTNLLPSNTFKFIHE